MLKQWSRGSEWHRWDPHIHTPSTLLSNHFAGDWDGFLAAVESAVPAVDALGITDYCVLNGYKQFLEFRSKGRAQNVALVFPNVEFRLPIDTKAGKGLNVHLLFSPADPDHIEQIERVLGGFTFEYKKIDYPCNPEWLMRLGRAVDPALQDDRVALTKGADQFKLHWDDLVHAAEEDAWMQSNCLVAISAHENDGLSGLKHDGAFEALREELKARPHIIFSANPGDRDFWLGRKPGFPREFLERTYGGLKPCLHGSDAHRVADVLRPAKNRYTWIRAEVSFTGLRQTVLDPETRVHIGESPPLGPSKSETIASLRISSAPWLQPGAIELNDGLVAIIGPKGSGKTALADVIAHAAGAQIEDEASFLRNAQEFLGSSEASLTWGDGTLTAARQLVDLGGAAGLEPHVRYLSQQFVDRLCSADTLGDELLHEIENVVFQAIPEEDRLGTSSFGAIRDIRLDQVLSARDAESEALEEANRHITAEEAKKSTAGAKRATLKTLSETLVKVEQDLLALLPKDKRKEVDLLAEVQSVLEARVRALQDAKLKAKRLDDLVSEHDRLKTAWVLSFEQLKTQYASCGLEVADWKALEPIISPAGHEVLAAARQRAATSVAAIEAGEAGSGTVATPLAAWGVADLQKRANVLGADIGIERDRAKKHRDLARRSAQLKQEIAALGREIADLDVADLRIKSARERRRKAYTGVFESFATEKAVLEELYAPLGKHLASELPFGRQLEFYVKREIDLQAWVERGEALLDLRKAGPFRRGRLEEVARLALLGTWRTGSAAEVESAMATFASTHWGDLVSSKLPDTSTQDLARWMLSTEHVSLRYGIRYDGVEVSRLSPGMRGIVLLMLYLAVDQWDTRPLLVDQPEENLDPQSVYEELVKYFRSAKRRRQVILVTHNPNLVVNADADQVIVATAVRPGGPGLPTISYTGGGLEDADIRGAVCRILEGGERAFLERERRYALPKDSRTAPV